MAESIAAGTRLVTAPAPMTTTGNMGLDALADAIAARVLARLNESQEARLLSVNEAARYIGRTPKALRHMIANGVIPAVREGGRLAGEHPAEE